MNASATQTPEAVDLLDAQDHLNRIKSLVEIIFMAAFDLGDRKKTNAVQNVVEVIHREIEALHGELEAIREGGQA